MMRRKQNMRSGLETDTGGQGGRQHELAISPLVSLAVKCHTNHVNDNKPNPVFATGPTKDVTILPQYALLGFHIGDHEHIQKKDPIFLNTNSPTSAFICGSQGSGKSFTLACMLENCLHPDPKLGKLVNPVAGVVFHYDVDASAHSVAEAAHLCSRGIKVNVFVSQSNKYKLKAAYTQLEGATEHLTVHTLLLRSQDLDVRRMNRLMAFGDREGSVPLYMEVIQRILREITIESRGGAFNYGIFKEKLKDERFSRDQEMLMKMRFNLLESFMYLKSTSAAKKGLFELEPGTLTIVDLSDPFLDASTACILFDICLGLVKEARPRAGLVVALDEAHKFMNDSSAANAFTDSLLTTIREQRHNATRVIIATQEPTVSEKLLDLCSMTIVHRFTSPAWFNTIKGHLGAATSLGTSDDNQKQMFDNIMQLGVGESFVFSPSSFLCMKNWEVKKLALRAMKMKTRRRLGVDGGRSKMAN